MIGFSTTTLDIPHCTSANLTPVADPRLITGHSFANAFCTVESVTSGLNFGTNKGIRFKSLPGPRLTPAHTVTENEYFAAFVAAMWLCSLTIDKHKMSVLEIDKSLQIPNIRVLITFCGRLYAVILYVISLEHRSECGNSRGDMIQWRGVRQTKFYPANSINSNYSNSISWYALGTGWHITVIIVKLVRFS